jgi:hypothetical protein
MNGPNAIATCVSCEIISTSTVEVAVNGVRAMATSTGVVGMSRPWHRTTYASAIELTEYVSIFENDVK